MDCTVLVSIPGRGTDLFSKTFRLAMGGHPDFYIFCTGCIFLGVKRPGRKAKYSTPYCFDVTSKCRHYLCSPSVCLRLAQGQLSLYFMTITLNKQEIDWQQVINFKIFPKFAIVKYSNFFFCIRYKVDPKSEVMCVCVCVCLLLYLLHQQAQRLRSHYNI